MNFQPLFDKVLIKRSEVQDEVTAGGIYVPPSAQQKPNQGVVVAVGSGKQNSDGTWSVMPVKKDDNVLFSEFSGLEVKLPEGTFLLMSVDEILGVFREKVDDKNIPF